MNDLEPILRDRPVKVAIQTVAEFDELHRMASEGRFRIHAVEIGRPRGRWRWRFELVWPVEQMELDVVARETHNGY
jgi:hypothetical protein